MKDMKDKEQKIEDIINAIEKYTYRRRDGNECKEINSGVCDKCEKFVKKLKAMMRKL